MTAVAEDTDLSWVTFTDDSPEQQCGFIACSRVTLFLAIYERPCGHGPNYDHCCTMHRDMIVEASETPGDLFCSVCEITVRLLRIEPLR